MLSPEGILLISTPNRDLVSPGWSLPPNRFHLREWSATEFAVMLRAIFPRVVLRGQIPGKKLIERRESGRKARKLAIQIERAIGLDPRGLIPSGVRSLLHRGKRADAINEKTAEASPAALPSPSDLESRVRSLVQLGLSAGGPELDGLFRYGPAEDGEQSVAWCSIAGDVASASSAR